MSVQAGTAYVPFEGDFSGLISGLSATLSSAHLKSAGKKGGLVIGGAVVGGIAAAGIGKALSASVGKAIDWQSSFADVRKTVDATEKGYARLAKGIRGMSKVIPTSANELAELAGVAGQLGVKNRSILKFTRTVADLGETTNLHGEEAATTLARIANIMQTSEKDYGRMGSTIVELGNNLATTEAEITEMALRLAKAGGQVGLSEAQVLAFSGALSSVGIEAEAGGSAFSKAFIAVAMAAAQGGKDLEKFSSVAGVSGRKFAEIFEKDAARAMVMLTEGLGRVRDEGGNVFGVLEELGIKEVRMRDAMLGAAGAGDLFRKSLNMGSKAWKENTALADEAAQRYGTTESQMQMLKNTWDDVMISLGEMVRPTWDRIIRGVRRGVARVGRVLGDPDLTGKEKFEQIIEMFADAVIAGIGRAAKKAAELAPSVAQGFARGFVNAPIWAQIAASGLLLKMFGGPAAIAGAGTRAGVLFTTAFESVAQTYSLARSFGRGRGTSAFAGIGSLAMPMAKTLFTALRRAIPAAAATFAIADVVMTAISGDLKAALKKLGAGLAGAGIGLLIGGPIGAALGAGIGVAVGGALEDGRILRSIGEKLAPITAAIGEKLEPVTKWLAEAWRDASHWVSSAARDTRRFVGELLPVQLAIIAVRAALRAVVGYVKTAAPVAFAALKVSLIPIGATLAVIFEGFRAFYEIAKAVAPVLKFLGIVMKEIVAAAFTVIAEAVVGVIAIVKRWGAVFGNVIGVVSNLLRGDWANAWRNMKELFFSVLDLIKEHFVRVWRVMGTFLTAQVRVVKKVATAGFSAIRQVIENLGDAIPRIFGRAWKTAKTVFRVGANAVIDLVNAVIGVINKIPGVNIKPVGKIGGDAEYNLQKGVPIGRQKGGIVPGTGDGDKVRADLPAGSFILNKKATKAYGFARGGAVPLLLEPGERYFLPDEVKKIGADRLDAMNKTVQRFQKGGPVGLISGGKVIDAAKDVVSRTVPGADLAGKMMGKGASWFVGRLPKPQVPEPFTGLGPWLIDHVKEWIGNKVPKVAAASRKVPGYVGPPVDMRMLGNNAWVDSHTLAVGAYLVKKFGVSITDGWRPQNAGYGAVNSSHKRGTPGNPGALDFAPPSTALQAFAAKHIAGLTENDIHDWGTGLHNHIAFFARGGLVRALQALAKGGWVKTGYTTYDDSGGGYMGSLQKGNGYAELGTATRDGRATGTGYITQLLGLRNELPHEYPLDVKINGRTKRMFKRDRGYGQGTSAYSIDIYKDSWGDFGLTGHNKGTAHIRDGKGSGDEEPTKAEKTRRERSRRRKFREDQIAKMRRQARKATSPLASKGAWWRLLAAHTKWGMFDKGEGAHLLSQARGIASIANPNRGAGRLSQLAGWMDRKVDITGSEDENEVMSRKLERVKKQGEKIAKKQRKRVMSRIARLSENFPYAGRLKRADSLIANTAEWIELAEREHTADWSPGGSEYTDSEVDYERRLNENLLRLQKSKRGTLGLAIPYARHLVEMYRGSIRHARRNPSERWRIPGFKRGLSAATSTLGSLTEARGSLVGVTGKGGEIADTLHRLAELGSIGTTESAAASERDSAIADVLREQLQIANRNSALFAAQLPIFDQFLPRFHTGGIVPGRGEQPAVLKGGEGVFTREQMAALGQPGDVVVNVYVDENAGVDPERIRVEVENVARDRVSRVRRRIRSAA